MLSRWVRWSLGEILGDAATASKLGYWGPLLVPSGSAELTGICIAERDRSREVRADQT